MTPEEAIAQLEEFADADKAKDMLRYHKIERRYLGLTNPQIDTCTKEWRKELELPARIDLAKGLWATDIYEGRVAAAKMFTQARIKPDDTEVWEMIKSWVPDFDCWAIADHGAMAGQRRLLADTSRIDDLEPWTASEHLWTKRAALVMTLPWNRQRDPKPEEIEIRERVLGWAASYVPDHRWFIQKAIGWWLRELSKKDPERVIKFLNQHAEGMKRFAVVEASRKLPDNPF